MTSLFDYMQQQYPDFQSLANQSIFMQPQQGGEAGGSGTGKLHGIMELAKSYYGGQLMGGGTKGFAPNEADIDPKLLQTIQGYV